MNSATSALPDRLIEFCSDQPASTFCWNVKVDADSTLIVSHRTRADIIQDACATAQRFLQSGLSQRQCGEQAVNVSFFARSGYDLFVGFLAALINRWTVSRCLFVDSTLPNLVNVVQRQVPNVQIIPLQGVVDSSWTTLAQLPIIQGGDSELDAIAYNLHTSGSTGELLCKVLNRFSGAICVTPPALLEQISSMGEKAIQALVSTYMVLFAGAPLQEHVGNRLASHGVRIVSAFGSTETGQLTIADVSSDDPLDWPYVRFIDPSEIELVDEPNTNGLWRLVVKPGRFVSSNLVNYYCPIGFSPGDLWKEHPTRQGLWKHAGRLSNVTVLSNGEKTDNIQLESLVLENPFVERVIVFGEGRFQNGLLVLPQATALNDSAFAASLWSTIQHVNSITPTHSRVVRVLTVLANPKKPFVLTDKGTIRRHETLVLYSKEIQEAYAALESGDPFTDLPSKYDDQGVLMYIKEIAARVFGVEVAVHDDLFACGMDSLSATNFNAYLTPLWKLVRNTRIPHNIVYKYPSIDALHQVITRRDSHSTRSAEQLDDIIKKWSFPCPTAASRFSYLEDLSRNVDDVRLTVLLTGSRGGFGSHILSELLNREEVRAVYCLDRTNSRSLGAHTQRMPQEAITGKRDMRVEFWTMELRAINLGLDTGIIQKIQTDVTHIVHCAWDVNFNHELEHFLDPHVRALHKILNLSASSVRTSVPRMFFISSISAVANYSGSGHGIPEVPLDCSSLPLDQGYAQSKYVGERVLIDASRGANIPVTIVRTGQLAGSTTLGAWNMTEYIPIFIQACFSLKLIPSHIPSMSWTPIDVAAAIFVDIMLNDADADTTHLLVRHIDNPKELASSDFLQWMLAASDNSITLVPNEEWLDSVRHSQVVMKAKHLLPFFEQWLGSAAVERKHRVLSLQHTEPLSGSFARAQITHELFRKYVDFIRKSSSIKSSMSNPKEGVCVLQYAGEIAATVAADRVY
ncbi:hypothetical protein AZE42_04249 [Rhizopogon vesiculosus]|uniref:Uncharacterized protein n=1 Tax=Rhizopogon vesiculosus TaxID=180088 RepID=A0A1J8PWK1_9AGAM|nr:hypothetical protein AZE42_04249 [Rhizopogon vesiculosus]